MIAAMNFDPHTILNDPYFIQGVGFVAFAFGVSAFLVHSDKRLKVLLLLQCLFLSSHFYLLGAHTAAGTTTITAVRNIASLFGKLKLLAPVFIIAYVTAGIYRYTAWYDALPIVAPIVSTIGLFYLSKVRMRLCLLFSTSCWIVHNFVVGSIGPFFMEVFIFSSNLFTILSMTGAIRKLRVR